jgi:hypothetical protein
MLAKKTSKNQITLPKAIITRFGEVDYFDVSTDGESIVLRPLRQSRADEARERLAQMGITEEDVRDADPALARPRLYAPYIPLNRGGSYACSRLSEIRVTGRCSL